MANEFTPFLISEFKTGISTYLKPWIRPSDAMDPLVNAYIYRGTIRKRNGYSQFGAPLGDGKPVMGIMKYLNEDTGISSLLVASTRNLYRYDAGSNSFVLINAIDASPFFIGTVTGIMALPTFWPNLLPSSISITDGTTTITDDGIENLSSGGIFAAGSTINYTTGVATIHFTGSTANTTLTITATLAAPDPAHPTFTGTINNFFAYTNWQPVTGAASTIYMTNNEDPVTTYNGTGLARPYLLTNQNLTAVTINTCLDLKVYKQHLLYISPTLSNGDANQTIWWSKQNNPLNVIQDVAGNGGFQAAPTGDIIVSAEFIRDILVVFFSNSTWLFRFTNVVTDLFLFSKVNDTKSTNAPYASVAYDERCTSIGNTGFIACDGTNLQRYDIPIIDYYETNFDPTYYAQSYAQRYDNLNQAWTLYVSSNRIPAQFPLVDGVAPGSDKALVYNFLENTWATYDFQTPLTCLGSFYAPEGKRWRDLPQPWEVTDVTWNSYGFHKNLPILLAGDTTGNVYYMDNSSAVTDTRNINVVLATGNGTTTYSGTLAGNTLPVWPTSFTAANGLIETFTDNGTGKLTGSAGGTGSINYTTGAWALTFNAPVAIGDPITGFYKQSFTIVPDIVTTRWNPVISVGQKVQFGYVDIYYYIATNTSNNPIAVTLNFYADNSENIALQKRLTLDGPTQQASQVIAVGNGGSYYSGTITNELLGNSIEISVLTSNGMESFNDNGAGILEGSLGNTGTVNYSNGDWTITLSASNVAIGVPFNCTYSFYSSNSDYTFKRIYINLIGEFIQMEIDPDEDAYMEFLGFILWARPAGRLTP